MRKKLSKNNWVWEFSKRLVIACTLFYFIGVGFACAVMLYSGNYEALTSLIDNLHEMLRVCVFGYFVKACVENTFKIRLNRNEEEE